MTEVERPLSGIRVLGLEAYIAGPYCTMMLADAGAEVIKIEAPGIGDPRRALPPFATNKEGARSSGGFMRFNRNKKSLALDLKQEEGREIFRSLVKVSDVIVENLRPDTMEGLGLSYEMIRQINPGIIYAALSGFGRMESLRGPYSGRPAFDTVIQAMGGLMHNVGQGDGPPMLLGIPIVDISTPLIAAFGICLALRVREKTGQGQFVDTAMYDCATALNEGAVIIYSYNKEIPGRDKPRLQAPQHAFKTKDGYVALLIPNENVWRRFCKAVGREDLVEHPLCYPGLVRAKNYDHFLAPILDDWFAKRTNKEAIQELLAQGVPVGPSQTAKDLVECPHLKAREMVVDIQDPVGGIKKMVGSPVKLSKTPRIETRRPPDLGEHSEEILGSLLGFGKDQIDALRQKKVI